MPQPHQAHVRCQRGNPLDCAMFVVELRNGDRFGTVPFERSKRDRAFDHVKEQDQRLKECRSCERVKAVNHPVDGVLRFDLFKDVDPAIGRLHLAHHADGGGQIITVPNGLRARFWFGWL